MNDKPKTQSEWLRQIDPDQNVTGLGTLVNALKNGVFKKWFLSQLISPVVAIARYNPVTGHLELGPEDRNEYTIYLEGTSAANTDITITNGETWEIWAFMKHNGTQAAYARLFYSADGVNFYPFSCGGATGLNLAFAHNGSSSGPIRITGDGTRVLRAGLNAFAGGDTCRTTLIYRRVN